MIKNVNMSNIARAPDALIKESKPAITGMDIARSTGIQMAQISRIRNGHQVWVNPDDLQKISAALAKGDKSEKFAMIHAQLLFARLQDECAGPGAKYITLNLLTRAPAAAPQPAKPKPVLPPAVQADLDVIAEHIATDRDIFDLVRTVAKICHGKAPSQPASKQNLTVCTKLRHAGQLPTVASRVRLRFLPASPKNTAQVLAA